jgi:predicted TIM-barrel fold metal-dependent hydrolase
MSGAMRGEFSARSAAVERIRARLDHPIIDSDGHLIEFLPAVRARLHELAGARAVQGLDTILSSGRLVRQLDAAQRRVLGAIRVPWWGLPARNTLDRATAMLPCLLHERLESLGIDFAVLYPTYGLFAMSLADDEVRRAACRAFNQVAVEACEGLRDRLSPVAIVPMHTPGEAIAELEHAVVDLGMRAVLAAGAIARPLPVENAPRAARWMDTLGLDSPHDYDPFWRRCEELGVAPTFHSSGMGWDGRASPTSYVHNHLGNFALAGEATCRSLFLAGVPWRFPRLRFAFLEGGVGWARELYAGLIGHWEKRGRGHIAHYDPAALDRARLGELFERYAPRSFRRHRADLEDSLHVLSDPSEDRACLDEFAACSIAGPEDIREVFTERFFFGCEADDPLNASAFDVRANPLGARLRAIFSSDIGHWDVPDMTEVLPEAFELVERGLLDERDFRDFTFANPIALWAGRDAAFFAGTAVAEAVRAFLAEDHAQE